MSDDYELRAPRSREEWTAYHDIRRTVLFEARGRYGVYDENHPDEFKGGNHPLLLLHRGSPVGTVRVDLISDERAVMRLVAVHPEHRGLGHGRILLALAEDLARTHKCSQAVSNAATDALGFYTKAGYREMAWDDPTEEPPKGIVQVGKPL